MEKRLLEQIDWNLLATKLPMTGADIKNAADRRRLLGKI